MTCLPSEFKEGWLVEFLEPPRFSSSRWIWRIYPCHRTMSLKSCCLVLIRPPHCWLWAPAPSMWSRTSSLNSLSFTEMPQALWSALRFAVAPESWCEVLDLHLEPISTESSSHLGVISYRRLRDWAEMRDSTRGVWQAAWCEGPPCGIGGLRDLSKSCCFRTIWSQPVGW